MNLMRWFRKNNKKVMAIVVVVIMFGFIAGPTLRYFARIRMGWRDAVAYIADNKKITRSDLMSAHQELEILKLLRADALLRSQDIRGILLAELLFTEQKASPLLINHIKRLIRTNRYRISDKQISDIYRRSLPADYYWYCLKTEAELSGIRVANEDMGRLLGRIMPRAFQGLTYSQVIRSIINNQQIPEEQILTTFGKLMAVLQYSHMVCSNENVTNSQMLNIASLEGETINVELVEFDSSVFTDRVKSEPDEAALVGHFDKYKNFFVGTITEENPYGFGYKLPDRAQLEYIVCRLDDVSQVVTPPAPQEKEEYYRRNIEQFKVSVPSDPNDPNSLQIERTQSYAEVAGFISDKLLQDKINSKAEKILQEAKTLTEAGLEDTDIGAEKLTFEQFRQLAGDYTAAAEQLSEKYKVKIYTGQTGLLSSMDIQNNRNLGALYTISYGKNPVSLIQIVFAIDELKASELGPFDMAKPRMYENIGPLRDLFGQMMALVRIVKAEPASGPQSIDETFSVRTLILDPNQKPNSEDIYSVRENVVEDLQKLAAMDITRSKAEEFIELTAENGWDSAINKFNDLYGKQAKKEPNDPDVFQEQSFTDLQRFSNAMLGTLAVQNISNPAVQFVINESAKQAQFIDKLYSLVPQDSNTVDSVPLIMEFKPDLGFYVIKNISVKRLTQPEYERVRAQRLYIEDNVQTQSLSAIYLNPENILKRVDFRFAKKREETTDANTPAESEEAM